MIHETIRRIEKNLLENETIGDTRKKELLELVDRLKGEIESLGEDNHEHAGSIASFTESSVREATRLQRDSELLEHSLKGMSLSVRKFEVSHPALVGIINSIGQSLNSIGI